LIRAPTINGVRCHAVFAAKIEQEDERRGEFFLESVSQNLHDLIILD
jgi:hypothetical protein